MNHFEFFQLPEQFDVDTTLLKQRFLENSRKYHPDFHTLQDAAAQVKMLELATQNNLAYKTLQHSDSRLRYILEINDMFNATQNEALPPGFLMEMMELNEQLDDAEGDATKIEAAQNEIQTILDELENEAADTLIGKPTPTLLAFAKSYFLKKQYLHRLNNRLENS
ncbi:MAG: Fe-S protein assembly co-chaperone HscB [Saprospiraceae bacterium]|nr:Fe-S protein assembly co-chaperone HscB [Saprospiraceae bacterium]